MHSIIERGVSSAEPESVIKVGSESVMREADESGKMSVTVRAVESGVEECTLSLTGRMALASSMTGGVEESSEAIWPESVGGGGTGDEEAVTGLLGVVE